MNKFQAFRLVLPKHFVEASRLASTDPAVGAIADAGASHTPMLVDASNTADQPQAAQATVATTATAVKVKDEGYTALVEMSFTGMKVPELKKQCKEMNLSQSGTKNDLRQRLVEHIVAERGRQNSAAVGSKGRPKEGIGGGGGTQHSVVFTQRIEILTAALETEGVLKLNHNADPNPHTAS